MIATLAVKAAIIAMTSAALFTVNTASAPALTVSTPAASCWFEKPASIDTAEMWCGDPADRPAANLDVDSYPASVEVRQVHADDVPETVFSWAIAHGAFVDPTDHCKCAYVPEGTPFGPADDEWVATISGIEPAPTN